MNRVFSLFLFIFLLTPPAAAQDPAAVWQALSQPVLDPAKSTTVSDLTIERDRIKIRLVDGKLQFTQPAAGVVFGAAFQGHGKVEIEPPNPIEQQQLHRFTQQDKLSLSFTDATFSFSDNTFDEIAKQVGWKPAGSINLGGLYASRQNAREDVGFEIVPRLFQGVMSGDHARTAYFVADLNTDDFGWVLVRDDALELEDIQIGRWTDWVGRKGYDVWMQFPSGGRSPVVVGEDPTAKDDFDVRSYKIQATVSENTEIESTTRMELVERASGERVLRFALDSNLRVDTVKDSSGAALPFFQSREKKDGAYSHGDTIAVVLPQPTKTGDSLTLEFHYQGKKYVVRRVGNGNFFCQSERWYPTAPNEFAKRSDFEITFRSPKKLVLIATGDKVSEQTEGNWTVSTWKSSIPLAVAGFAFGDYKLFPDKADQVDVNVYANRSPDDLLSFITLATSPVLPSINPQELGTPAMGNLNPTTLGKTMAAELANNVRLFQTYFGPYPYSHLSATNIIYGYGQGWPGLLYLSILSFMDPTQRNNLGIHADVELTDFFRGHETSHQWWGHKVGWKTYHDQWLSEGFATFSGNLYVQYRQSWKEYLNRIHLDKQGLLNKNEHGRVYNDVGPLWLGIRLAGSNSPLGYNVVVYSKGGIVLNMIRMMMFDPRNQDPDARFKAMMQDFCKTYDNKAASTEDFKAVVEKYMTAQMDLDGNHHMNWFFRQYVYSTGIAQYAFAYKVEDAGEGKFKITGTLSRSGVPDQWEDILPLYAHSSGKTMRIGWLTVRQKSTSFDFELPARPDKLTLNDSEDIFALIQQP